MERDSWSEDEERALAGVERGPESIRGSSVLFVLPNKTKLATTGHELESIGLVNL
jgi:hypothetical protein